jgi:polyhydroxybutyrate depolymerase
MKADKTTLPGPGKYRTRLTWEGLRRTYLVHVPQAYDGLTAAPALLVLHGGGGSAEFAYRVHGWTELSERRGCLVVFPEATAEDPERPAEVRHNPRIWNDGSRSSAVSQRNVDDVGYVAAVLEEVQQTFAVDPRRVFVTGFSNGASMTFRVGVELADRVAAIAPVAGHLCCEDPKPARPLSLLYMIGLADPINPFDGGPTMSPWGTWKHKPPVMDSIHSWLCLIGAAPDPHVLRDSDGVQHLRYGPGASGCEVQLLTIEGQGHEWPGAPRTLPRIISGPQVDTVNGTDAVWDFFMGTHTSRDG